MQIHGDHGSGQLRFANLLKQFIGLVMLLLFFAVCLNVFVSGLSCDFRAVVSVITNRISVFKVHFFICFYSCFVLFLELKR